MNAVTHNILSAVQYRFRSRDSSVCTYHQLIFTISCIIYIFPQIWFIAYKICFATVQVEFKLSTSYIEKQKQDQKKRTRKELRIYVQVACKSVFKTVEYSLNEIRILDSSFTNFFSFVSSTFSHIFWMSKLEW